jgi:serine/threonine protein kinase
VDSNLWDRVELLFLEAAELRPEARPLFLDDACAGNPQLRAEVESLLANDIEADTLISRPLEQESALVLNWTPLEGERLGSYRLIREIGRGGMGAVYLATRDDDQYQKQVAVKVVRRGMDTADVLQRFRHERQILAGLEHPFIARLIDGGCTQDGRPFLVMELVEGERIDRYCRDRNPPIEDRCRTFLKVCEAVSYAHRKLVVHRDLKPGNILLTVDGSPKLLDFGLAKILDPEIDGRLTQAAAQSRPLTPDYASPEQLRGEALTTATDIYSLGVILRELLAGTRPNRDLDNIVIMATRQEIDRRYVSVDEFAQDIRCSLDSRPVKARADSLWYRTAKLLRRRRWALLAAAAVLASLVGGIVIAMSQARRAEDRLAQMVSLSNNSLSDVAALMERLSGTVAARKELIGGTLDSLEKLSKDAGRNTPLRIALARAYLRLGELQGGPDSANMGDVTGALKSYRAATSLLDGAPSQPRSSGQRLVVWLNVQHNTGKLLAARNDVAGATAVLRHAVDVVNALPAADLAGRDVSRHRAGLYLALSRATFHANLPQARDYAADHRNTLAALVKQYPADADLRYDLSVAHIELGWVLLHLGDPETAAAHYQQSMQLREQLVKERPADALYRRSLMLAYEHVGSVQGGVLMPNLGKTEVARAYYKMALPLEEAAAADPQNSQAAGDYAGFLLKSASLDVGRDGLAESLATLRRAVAIFESQGPHVYDLKIATTYIYIGQRLVAMARYPEAVAQFQHTLSIADAFHSAHPLDWDAFERSAEAELGITRALMLSGNRAGAWEHAGRLVLKAKESRGHAPESPLHGSWAAQAQLSLAAVHRTFQEWAPARDAAQQAIRDALPLSTGRVWDPNAQIVRDAKALLASLPGNQQ